MSYKPSTIDSQLVIDLIRHDIQKPFAAIRTFFSMIELIKNDPSALQTWQTEIIKSFDKILKNLDTLALVTNPTNDLPTSRDPIDLGVLCQQVNDQQKVYNFALQAAATIKTVGSLSEWQMFINHLLDILPANQFDGDSPLTIDVSVIASLPRTCLKFTPRYPITRGTAGDLVHLRSQLAMQICQKIAARHGADVQFFEPNQHLAVQVTL